jgi:hypothetical protein
MDVSGPTTWMSSSFGFASQHALGDRIDGWQVCCLGGWDRYEVFFVVMVLRESVQCAGESTLSDVSV